MPHKCMDCKNLIESGTIDLQKGCPICGGKKFQYVRPRPAEEPSPTVAEYVARAALREPQLEAKGATTIPEKRPRNAAREQAAIERLARSEANPEVKPEARPEPKLAEKLRRPRKADITGERIESIRIVEQGTYDINLPMLMSRKELVMSREEGSYVVDLNSALKNEKKLLRKKKRDQDGR